VSCNTIRDTVYDAIRVDRAYGRYVVYIRLLHHRTHRVLHGPICEFVVAVLVPYHFEVEARAVEAWLEMCE
jgi:hypothetical protein